MDIERFEFYPPNGNDIPTTLGLNVQRSFGLTCVNMFAIDENKGALVHENLWRIANEITRTILIDEKINTASWTFSTQAHTTGIRFFPLDDQPCKLDLSNRHALTDECYEWARLTLSAYREKFSAPMSLASQGKYDGAVKYPFGQSLFCVPCDHPDAKDGVFYCEPSYYDSHVSDDYRFILADTKRVIAQLQQDDPGMLAHSERKLSGSSAEQWLQSTTMECPRDMGMWSYDRRYGLRFCSGQADLIKVAADLEIPYFPMCIAKSAGADNIVTLRRAVGYDQTPSNPHPTIAPVFS